MKMTAPELLQRARKSETDLRALPIEARVQKIETLKRVILKNRERILDRLQRETGKSRGDALMSEIFPCLDHLDYLVKNAKKILTDRSVKTPIALLGKKSWVSYEPLGTILVISPWNYPLYQAITPCTTAFASGNAVIYKPSEHTPMEGLIEGLLDEAQWDPLWIQVAYGDGIFSQELIDQKPDKIFFTGSTRTGKRIMAQAAQFLIPIELELGGKDPMIVFDDVCLERSVAGALWGAMTHSGQSCTSVERLYVQRPIYENFKKSLVEAASCMTQAVDSDGSADMGRMTTDFQVRIVVDHLEDALKRGARQLTGHAWDRRSRQIPPILLEGVTHEMKVMREETFGPILPLLPFDSENEAIRLANDSDFGLSASVWSRDLTRARRVADALKTGNVSINNVMLTEGNHHLPFGGRGQSGFGRYKGEWGLHCFCNIKALIQDRDSRKIEPHWYPYTRQKYQLFTKMMLGLFTRGILNKIRFIVHGLKLESRSSTKRLS